MHLAKPHVDVGLMARQIEPMLEFWQNEVGLAFDHLLPTGRGNHQHRHDMNGSVLKLNASRDALPDTPPTGYRELWIAREGEAGRELQDPDGNRVRLVAPGGRGIVGIAMRLGVRDPDRHGEFYRDAFGLEEDGGGVFVCGDSRLIVEHDPDATGDASITGAGYRYLTVQVHDCDAETERALAHGATLGAPARTLGDVARFSMVRDPDGNWLEISQRRSLTGALPAVSFGHRNSSSSFSDGFIHPSVFRGRSISCACHDRSVRIQGHPDMRYDDVEPRMEIRR